jgi:DNA-directed RNA polymerase specialized sigma subunit
MGPDVDSVVSKLISAVNPVPISDVISEGNIGLMKALKRFEPERGFRLAT